MNELIEGEDYYYEGALMVFTRKFHLERGYCCGSGCRHCPYDPRWSSGTTTIRGEGLSNRLEPPSDCQR